MTNSNLVESLIETIGKDAILTHEEASVRPASVWRAGENLQCKALARPKNTSKVSEIMKICFANNQTVIPHGGLTNVVGGVKTYRNYKEFGTNGGHR